MPTKFISFNPFAAGYLFDQYKMMQKMPETLAHGYSSERYPESYPMHTNMTGFRWFCILVLWTKVALALENFEDKDFMIKLF